MALGTQRAPTGIMILAAMMSVVPLTWGFGLERAKGIEPSRPAWKAANAVHWTSGDAGERHRGLYASDRGGAPLTSASGTLRARCHRWIMSHLSS